MTRPFVKSWVRYVQPSHGIARAVAIPTVSIVGGWWPALLSVTLVSFSGAHGRSLGTLGRITDNGAEPAEDFGELSTQLVVLVGESAIALVRSFQALQ